MQAPSLTSCGKAKAARGSVRRSALCKHHHLLSVGRQRQQEDQQGGLRYASTITYCLWKGKGSRRISKEVCTMQAPSLTVCGKAKAARGSARRSALCKHHHLLPVERQRQQEDQQGGLHYASTITYCLWEGKGSKRISKEVCTMQAPSLTSCGKTKAAGGSPRRSALCKHHHLLPVGRQRQQEDQQGGLHYASTITYFLWKDKGSKRISKEVCTMQAPSLTYCGKAKATRRSARRSALCMHHHLHTVGRQRQQEDQQGGLHYACTITYILWEGKGSKRISKEVCTMQAPSLTLCGKAKAARGSTRRSAQCKHHHLLPVGRQRQQEDQQGGPHYASTIK